MNMSFLRRIKQVSMCRMKGSVLTETNDLVAAEEPLEIRVEGQSVAVVMRTPGEDRELAAGFLATEGLVREAGEVLDISYRPHCSFTSSDLAAPLEKADPENKFPNTAAGISDGNVIEVRLKNPETVDRKKLTRHLFTSSSCGICSKASIEAIRQQFPPLEDESEIDPKVLQGLPQSLAVAQENFKQTGGLHACALFDLTGKLLVLREDVGRHNALDKVVGWALLQGCLPLRERILLFSGRTSFEMVQKSLAAGVSVVAAISAPSGLAVEFARENGQVLVGFLRGEKMNIYAGASRLRKIHDNQSSSRSRAAG
jgi:FdhD protein